LRPDIILVTETWCKEDVTDAYLSIPGYELQADLRRDRKDTANGIGGGLLVYATHGLAVLAGDNLSDFNQHISFKILTGNDILHFVLLYRPPSAGPESIVKLNRKYAPFSQSEPIFFIGDFNLPEINWSNMQAPARLMDTVLTCLDNNLVQLIDQPTHIRGNVLDLVLTNVPERVTNIENQGRLGTSDHVILSAKILVKAGQEPSAERVPDWRRADWAALKGRLGRPALLRRLEESSVEGVWECLRDEINTAVDLYVPKRQRRTGNRPKWMSRDILRALRKKRRIWRKERNKDLPEYKEMEKNVKNLIRNAKRNYEKKLATQSKDNSRPFYSYLKRKTKCRTSVGPIKDKNGKMVTDPKEMAEIINQYFNSVFNRDGDGPTPTPSEEPELLSVLSSFNITEAKIKEKIKKLRPAAAPGPDSIGAGLLQELQDELAPALLIVYKKLLEAGHSPEDWRKANVSPIYKKGAKGEPGNYRPVSLTSVACKLFETLVRDAIIKHLDENNLVTDDQHGFVAGRSCATNLIEFYDKVTLAMDNSTPSDVVFLDFAKAFDKVPHKALLAKLRAYGIRGHVADWIENWLTDRKMRVVINGQKSGWMPIYSGVPQGSVLGPILFVIYINDIGAKLKSAFFNMFADDTKIGRTIVNQDDVAKLQEALDGADQWSQKWGMPFNVAKCKVMHIGNNNPNHRYTMAGQALESTAAERDVGVQITPKMNWSEQCAKAAATGSRVLGQICRAFSYRDKRTFIRLYKSYVRPHLEFSSPAWNPWLARDIEILERVQMRAVKMVGGLAGTTYQERLDELGLQSLEARRNEADVLLMHKVIHGACKVNGEKWHNARSGARTGARPQTRAATDLTRLEQPRARLEVRRNFYTVRIANGWNQLPQDLRETAKPSTFKQALRKLRAHAPSNRTERGGRA